MATVYLIHFQSKLSGHAQHYLGYTASESVEERFKRHKYNGGAKILQECNRQGIEYWIVRTWNSMSAMEAKELERRLKSHRHHSRFCPECNEHNYKNHGKEKPNGTSFESE